MPRSKIDRMINGSEYHIMTHIHNLIKGEILSRTKLLISKYPPKELFEN